MHQKTAVSHCIVHWNILWNPKISTSNLICSVQWSHCTGARFVDGWVDNYRMPKICSCLPCDTKHGAQAQYGHMYSAYSVVMGGGAWHWPGTPHTIHTYTCCCCRTAEAAMLPRQQPVTVGGTVRGTVRSTWYSVVQCGTHGPPHHWPMLPQSGRSWARSSNSFPALGDWRISTYLHIYASNVSTGTRHRNFSDKIPSVRFNDLSIYLSTPSKYGCGCGYIIWIEKPFNSSGLIPNV